VNIHGAYEHPFFGSEKAFVSPTLGAVSLEDMLHRIGFVAQERGISPHIVIGADSQCHGEEICFVCAVTAHYAPWGGIFFYRREMTHQEMSLPERLFREALLCLEMAETLKAKGNGFFGHAGASPWEIHLDLGEGGKSRQVLASVVGMIRGSGYICRTKPQAWGASKVADRYSK
jgi:predicted RNase H-related nuclease YkuK (DUF458 family)